MHYSQTPLADTLAVVTSDSPVGSPTPPGQEPGQTHGVCMCVCLTLHCPPLQDVMHYCQTPLADTPAVVTSDSPVGSPTPPGQEPGQTRGVCMCVCLTLHCPPLQDVIQNCQTPLLDTPAVVTSDSPVGSPTPPGQEPGQTRGVCMCVCLTLHCPCTTFTPCRSRRELQAS